MRISDWSSDVCSSDLNRCARVASPEMGTLPCAKNGDGRSPAIQRRFTMALKVSLLSDHVGAEIRADIDSLLTTAVAQEVRRVLIARGVVVFKRSEEHTSELQSLMRISYAVFCLK